MISDHKTLIISSATAATHRAAMVAGASKRQKRTSDDSKTAASTTKKPQRKQLSPELLSLATNAASAAHTFLLHNEPHLLPSQIHSLKSFISYISPPNDTLSASAAVIPSCSSPDWFRFFRMSPDTFSHLLSLLTPSLSSSLPSIPPESALASALCRLSHASSYKSIAHRFSLPSPADACRVFYTVCKAINDKFGNLVDLRDDWGRILVRFGWISLPNCCGVLGLGKFDVEGDPFGRNGSLLVQALVDSEGRFLDISAGWPCTMKPEYILNQSRLFSCAEESRELFNGPFHELGDGNLIPQYVVGDSCFPLLPWLITPYVRNNEEDSFGSAEKEFNTVHSRAMGLVGDAFGRVKARWQLLARRCKEDCVEFLPFVIVTGCLLHNFLIKFSEPMPDDDDDDVECFKKEEFSVYEGVVDENGRRVRDMLTEYMSRASQRR